LPAPTTCFDYREQPKFDQAEKPLLRRSLIIRDMAVGPIIRKVANSLDSLASLYFTQKRFRDAGAGCTNGPLKFGWRPGAGSFLVAQAWDNLAVV